MPEQDEEDVVRYGPTVAAPPVAAVPPISTIQQPAPASVPGNFTGSPAPVIDAAVGQLNAGQPITALPHQDWSLQQATAFNAKLDAFDQQAKHARIAADQAARDAQMFAQMSRVAKSTKDIEIALQQQDVMGFRNAVASGTPGYQALQQFPRAATSPLVAAMHAAQPVAPPTFGKTPSGAEYAVDARGGVHFTPGAGQQPAHKLGEVIPVKDPTTGEPIANVIATGPQTGHVQKLEGVNLTPAQQVQVQRARISAINAELGNAYLITDKKAKDKFIADKTAELSDISSKLKDLPNKAAPAAPAVPAAGTPAKVTTKAQRDALAPGTRYIGTDGRTYTKQ